jgi:hypothetical protein
VGRRVHCRTRPHAKPEKIVVQDCTPVMSALRALRPGVVFGLHTGHSLAQARETTPKPLEAP